MAIGTAFGEVGVIAGKRPGLKNVRRLVLKTIIAAMPAARASKQNQKKGQLSRFEPAIERKVVLISPRRSVFASLPG